MRLYDINEQIEQLLNQVDDDGCLPESVFAEIADLQIAESEKIEAIACFIKDLKAEAAEISEEAKRLAFRKQSKENKQDRLAEYLANYLQMTGKAKFETARCVLSFRKSNRVEITDDDALLKFASEHQDLGLTKIDVKTSKTAIGAAIKSGVAVPGAAMVEGQSLQVR